MIKLTESSRKNKKYQVSVNDTVIHFGQKGYDDYTIHKDDERKKRFYQRFKRTTDIYSPLFWSMNILWNKPTLKESIDNTNKLYGLNIKKI